MKIAIRQAVAVPPARAVAAYGTPSFYVGRPGRDDIAMVEVVRHDDLGERILIEVRFAFTGSLSPTVRARDRPRQDVVGHPDGGAAGGGAARAGWSCPTTTPTG